MLGRSLLRKSKVLDAGNRYSVYFNGTSSSLSLPNTGEITPGGSDFTAEMWVNPDNLSQNLSLWSIGYNAGATAGLRFELLTTGKIYLLGSYTGGWPINISGNIAISAGSWSHVAVCRSGSTLRAFVNGVQCLSTSVTSALYNGGYNSLAYCPLVGYYKGYMSNVRYCNTAIYTSNFTVPTSPLTVIPSCKLLCCQSATLKDIASSLTITKNGSPAISTNIPFV